MRTLSELGIPTSFVTQRHRLLHCECEDLVSIGLDMFGREQRLERRAASKWQSMLATAGQDGVVLAAISGFRSFDYQRKIIERKLAAGLTVEQIVCVSALPGFSEHPRDVPLILTRRDALQSPRSLSKLGHLIG